MSLLRTFLFLSSLVLWAWSKPLAKPLQSRDAHDLPPCGDIIAWTANGYRYFEASYVYKCLQSVPFNQAVATRFIAYYNTTLQFHAPLDTLKNPPSGYQYPGVDIARNLDAIQVKIDSGYYVNQYEFEKDIQKVVTSFHDPHVSLDGGILAAFSFASPYGIVSASLDGKESPKVYIGSHIIRSQWTGQDPSPIVEINGQDPQDFLMRYAETNAASYLEPDANWNSLMENPVSDVLGLWSAYQSGTLYPGEVDDAHLEYKLQDGTVIADNWTAIYEEVASTGPLATAGDFYNYFVLGIRPSVSDDVKWWPDRSINATELDDDSTEKYLQELCGGTPSSSSWCRSSYGAFPRTEDITQEDGETELYSSTADKYVAGYIFEDISTGVLSIPKFYTTTEGEDDTFRLAVEEFINTVREQKTKRVLIDLQRNSGGNSFRAYDTFKMFFPTLDPYAASTTRKHDLGDVLGAAYSKAFHGGDIDESYASNEWVVTNRLDADSNTAFSSWKDYYSTTGQFSRAQRYNLSDTDFTLAAFPEIPVGYDPEVDDEDNTQVFSPDDIVILTDGLCSSTCSLFVELMTRQAGVRTITAGGRPQPGPMQTVSGSRGAAAYTSWDLDFDIQGLNDTLDDQDSFAKFPRRSDTGMWVNNAGITIRNQVREGDDTPLQFLFQAADCRIFYTLKNVYNMTQLWYDAVKATWDDTSLCVKNSTGYPSARNFDSDKAPPAPISQSEPVVFDINTDPERTSNSTFEIEDGGQVISLSVWDYPDCKEVYEGETPSESRECLYMRVTCPPTADHKTGWKVVVPVIRKKCGKTTLTSDGCDASSECLGDYSLPDSKASVPGAIDAGWEYGYCQAKKSAYSLDLQERAQKWCTAAKDKAVGPTAVSKALRPRPNVAITTVKQALPPSIGCVNPILKKLVTATECSNRRWIIDSAGKRPQTMAVWVKTGKKGTKDVGTCRAYTCKAGEFKLVQSTVETTLFFWK